MFASSWKMFTKSQQKDSEVLSHLDVFGIFHVISTG